MSTTQYNNLDKTAAYPEGLVSNTIAVLGGTGMLGHKVFQVTRRRFPDTFCTIRGQRSDGVCGRISLYQTSDIVDGFDAMNFTTMESVLSKRQPKTVVNCIGWTIQRPEERDTVEQITLNALLPHKLSELCASWGGKLIHISTDGVFSGKRGLYTENDPPDAEDLYGKCKHLGEVNSRNALTLRTSFIGRELLRFNSLLEWFLSQNHQAVQGYAGVVFSGVTTNYLALVISDLIEHHEGLTGLYHVGSKPISKYNLLTMLKDNFKLDIEICLDRNIHCDRSLRCDKFRDATGYVEPDWRDLVKGLVQDSTPYDLWRKAPWSH